MRGRMVAVALVVAVCATPARAQDTGGPIEFVRNVPIDIESAIGSAKLGDLLYLTGTRALSIYSVADPLNPTLVSHVPYGYEFQNEDVSTNGKTLLISESLPAPILHVWDVSNPSLPVQTGIVPLAGDHTHECIADCTFSYGSEGSLVDLRDPGSPQLVGNWLELVDKAGVDTHDVEEVRPGLAVVSTISTPFFIMDVSDPLKPRVIAEGDHPAPDEWLFHSARWPNAATDPFLLLEAEGGSGPVMTWRVGGTPQAPTFTLIDSFTLGTTSHWFEEHPRFRGGGLLAVGWYGEGTRILEVNADGLIKEVAWFTSPPATGPGSPLPSTTWAAYWIDDRIVYAIDNNRGIDILRYTGEISVPAAVTAPTPAPPHVAAPEDRTTAARAAVTVAARRAAASLRRLRRGRRFSVLVEAPEAGVTTIRVLSGRRTVGAGSRRFAARGRGRVTVRLRRALARRATLTVRVGFRGASASASAQRTVRVRR